MGAKSIVEEPKPTWSEKCEENKWEDNRTILDLYGTGISGTLVTEYETQNDR